MDITLKQSDIEKAVKMYVERQGINLHSKTLTMTFAMGRGANGLSANLNITDLSLPAYDASADAPKVSGSANVGGALTGLSEGTTALQFAEHPAGKDVTNADDTKSVKAVLKSAENNVATADVKPATEDSQGADHVQFKDVNQALLASGGATPATTLPPVAAVVEADAAAPNVGGTVQDDDASVLAAATVDQPAVAHEVVEAAQPVDTAEAKPAKATTSLFG